MHISSWIRIIIVGMKTGSLHGNSFHIKSRYDDSLIKYLRKKIRYCKKNQNLLMRNKSIEYEKSVIKSRAFFDTIFYLFKPLIFHKQILFEKNI